MLRGMHGVCELHAGSSGYLIAMIVQVGTRIHGSPAGTHQSLMWHFQ